MRCHRTNREENKSKTHPALPGNRSPLLPAQRGDKSWLSRHARPGTSTHECSESHHKSLS